MSLAVAQRAALYKGMMQHNSMQMQVGIVVVLQTKRDGAAQGKVEIEQRQDQMCRIVPHYLCEGGQICRNREEVDKVNESWITQEP